MFNRRTDRFLRCFGVWRICVRHIHPFVQLLLDLKLGFVTFRDAWSEFQQAFALSRKCSPCPAQHPRSDSRQKRAFMLVQLHLRV
jgi:hypothetical protein